MRWLDAHCHLAEAPIFERVESVLKRAQTHGIHYFLQGGIGPEDWRRQAELTARFPGQIFPCYGLHPWWIAEREVQEARAGLVELSSWGRLGVAIGEVGLDFSAKIDSKTHALQIELFEAQLELNHNWQKPLILHVVKAHSEALSVLSNSSLPNKRGLVHSFSSNAALVSKYVELGFLISVGPGLIKKGFETLRKAVVSIPPNHLVIESDAPGQSVPEPAHLIEIAQAVGRLRGEDPGLVLDRSRKNIERVFDLYLTEGESHVGHV